MWIPKTKWAAGIFALVIVIFMMADCTNEGALKFRTGETESAADAGDAITETAADTASDADVDAEPEGDAVGDAVAIEDGEAQGADAATVSRNQSSVTEPQTAAVQTQSVSAPQSEPQPAPTTPARTVYTVIGPDGHTYSAYEPVYIVCLCGERFGSGAEWQAHRDWYSVFRCSCGAAFFGIGEWEAHAGIYDPQTYLYTGKSRAQASAEGHTLTNEDSFDSLYSAHNSWHTSTPAF
jgi:predicted  nucleic acid-binding Zn-ribbon protein